MAAGEQILQAWAGCTEACDAAKEFLGWGGVGLLLVASALGHLPLSPGLDLCLPLFPSDLFFWF